MTQKYLYVRREIYEQNPARKLNSTRNFADMVRIFKCSNWIMFGGMVLSLIGIIVFLFFIPSTLFILITMSLMTIISILSQVPREKYLYHESARKEELEKLQESYQVYVSEIWDILKKHDIDSPKKFYS